MRRSQYSVEQIIGILKQRENGRPTEGAVPAVRLQRKQTLKRWKAKYKGSRWRRRSA